MAGNGSGNGTLKTVLTVVGLCFGFAANIATVVGAWSSLKSDVAVVKEQIVGVRDDVNRHEQEIVRLRDARAEAKSTTNQSSAVSRQPSVENTLARRAED